MQLEHFQLLFIDWAKVSEIHTKRPALNDNMLKVERVQEPDSIFVSNIPENITKDHLLLKLEKVADVECDFEMNYEREQGFAIVKCNDLEGDIFGTVRFGLSC